MKRFGVIAVALAGAIAISTGGTALAHSTARSAPQAVRDEPVCPVDVGYASEAKDPFPAEEWQPVWTAFEAAVVYGNRYTIQRKRPTAAQTQRLEELLPGEAWKDFYIDRLRLRPSLKRRITGGLAAPLLGGPCLNAATGRAFFMVRFVPNFRYRGKRVKGLSPSTILFSVKDGQLETSYYLPRP